MHFRPGPRCASRLAKVQVIPRESQLVFFLPLSTERRTGPRINLCISLLHVEAT